MARHRALQVLLVILGVGLVAGLYPLQGALRNLGHTDISRGDQMILGIYFPIGIFLLLAVRNPVAHRSLIRAFGWSTLAHMTVMLMQAHYDHSLRDDAPPLIVISLLSVALIALTPRKEAQGLKDQPSAGQSG